MHKLSKSLFQIGPVMIGLFAVTFYLIIESSFLLYSSMPGFIGNNFFRALSASFIAAGIHLTVLTTAVNAKLISRFFSVTFAMLSALITAFFFGVFDSDKPAVHLYKDILFSFTIGLSNYVYVYLFVAKYEQSEQAKPLQESMEELTELLRQAEQDMTVMEQTIEQQQQGITAMEAMAEQQAAHSKRLLTQQQAKVTEVQATATEQQATYTQQIAATSDELAMTVEKLNHLTDELSQQGEEKATAIRQQAILTDELGAAMRQLDDLKEELTQVQAMQQRREQQQAQTEALAQQGMACMACGKRADSKGAMSTVKGQCEKSYCAYRKKKKLLVPA